MLPDFIHATKCIACVSRELRISYYDAHFSGASAGAANEYLYTYFLMLDIYAVEGYSRLT